VIMKPRKRGG